MNKLLCRVKLIGKIIIIVMALNGFISSNAVAHDSYSYANSEKLKPLIHWYNYGNKAVKQAKIADKPILILITAPSWCYWCQVYESRDDLFNPKVVKYVNSHFVPVYVDSDSRPGLTRKYLQGGWPSTVILTPALKKIAGFSGALSSDTLLSVLKKAIQKTVKQHKATKQHRVREPLGSPALHK